MGVIPGDDHQHVHTYDIVAIGSFHFSTVMASKVQVGIAKFCRNLKI